MANNGVSDESLCNILRGIREAGGIRKLECCRNAIGELSVFELANILSKASQEPFQELELSGVKISGLHLNSVLEMLSKSCSLTRLALARQAFDEISIDYLAKIARRAKNMYCFSIAGGELLASSLTQILKGLIRSKTLEYVDLSWLPLGSQGEMIVTELKQEISRLLCTFVARDKQLIHLDLSYSRLTDPQIVEIVSAMRKSESLLSLHLSGNGISDKGRKQAVEELKAETLKIGKGEDDIDQLGNAEAQSMSKHQLEEKRGAKQVERLTKDECLLFWRVRDHNEVFLASSGGWLCCNQCFICARWRYCVFAFDPEIARKRFVPMSALPSSMSSCRSNRLSRLP